MRKETKIPKEEVVKFKIRNILKNKNIKSQGELSTIVNDRLRDSDNNYSITGKRLRSIALNMPVKMQVATKHGKMPDKCPCCYHKLKKIHTKNLLGKKLLFGIQCSRCSYKGFEGKYTPMRYEFSL